MRHENMFLALVALLATMLMPSIQAANICGVCSCEGDTVNCTNHSLIHHFNATDWPNITKGEQELKVALFDYNNLIHVRVFPELPLTHLSLSHNHIVKIDECAFQNMTNLTELDLSFNQLTSSLLSEDVFKILDLSYNGLKFFPDTLLHTPRRLTTLLLEGNQLTTVPKGLSASHKLEHLTLSGNPIEVINVENGFPKLEFLKSLQLSYMDKLTRIEAGGLAKLTALEEFHCNHNPKLKFIDPTAFSRREDGEESEQWPPLTKMALLISKRQIPNFSLFYPILARAPWGRLVQGHTHARMVTMMNLPTSRDIVGNEGPTPPSLYWVMDMDWDWLKKTHFPAMELFEINIVVETNSRRFLLEYLRGKVITRGFYFMDLGKTSHSDVYLAEKIITLSGEQLILEPLPKSYRKKNKLEVGASIPTMPSWLGGVWTEPCAHACNLGPIWLNNNELEYLDSHLVARWDKLEILDIQVNPWMCDCENQWMVSTLVKVIENKTPDLARGIMCGQPEEMRASFITDLEARNYQMRCLDADGAHPERDSMLLVGVLVGVLLATPITLAAVLLWRKRRHIFSNTSNNYSRALYTKADLHDDGAI
uniref:Uncharacterized protein n=1 Tax=Timema bartmani TaxID=61472 RepID=A0A7R9I6B3_9NEOP|nr:unnamed protein product [Timema bartmani]